MALGSWPGQSINMTSLYVNGTVLRSTPGDPQSVTISTSQDLGSALGGFCPGLRVDGELPADQTEDDRLSVVFEAEPEEQPRIILGNPTLSVRVSSDKPTAFLAARLCLVSPDGHSVLVSWGVVNLTHDETHEKVTELEPGRSVSVRFGLNAVGMKLPAGHWLRLCLSNTLWPMVWPGPEPSSLTIQTESLRLDLPVLEQHRDVSEIEMDRFPDPDWSQFEKVEPSSTRLDRSTRADGTVEIVSSDYYGATRNDTGLVAGSGVDQYFAIHPDDPLSARAGADWVQTLERGDWTVRTDTGTLMWSDATHFHMEAYLRAYENDDIVYERTFADRVERHGN